MKKKTHSNASEDVPGLEGLAFIISRSKSRRFLISPVSDLCRPVKLAMKPTPNYELETILHRRVFEVCSLYKRVFKYEEVLVYDKPSDQPLAFPIMETSMSRVVTPKHLTKVPLV